jgi:hypothetical protein
MDVEGKDKNTGESAVRRVVFTRVPMVFVDRCLAANAVLTVQQRNPKTGKSSVLYDQYKRAASVNQVLNLGGRKADIQNDLQRGYMVLQDPELELELEAYRIHICSRGRIDTNTKTKAQAEAK